MTASATSGEAAMVTLAVVVAINVIVSLFGFRALRADGGRAETFLFVPHQVTRGKNGAGMLLAHFSHAGLGHLVLNMIASIPSAPL